MAYQIINQSLSILSSSISSYFFALNGSATSYLCHSLVGRVVNI